MLSAAGISRAAQPFFGVLLRYLFPARPIVVVTEGLKTQESFQQDIETWFGARDLTSPEPHSTSSTDQHPVENSGTPNSEILFYPAWEVLPHEAKLPHADIISERLEALVRLSSGFELPVLHPADDRKQPSRLRNSSKETGRRTDADDDGVSPNPDQAAPLVITTVPALMQRTFPARVIAERTRRLKRGDRIEPLDLIEWLEEQGYEPEAKVGSKGEIALRGGILDVYPLTSPWPVRLEFFGDELESLRYFDPVSQISREQVDSVMVPPAGEIGILKKIVDEREHPDLTVGREPHLAMLLDYLPRNSLFLLCDPLLLEEHAAGYARQIPSGDPFFVDWDTICREITRRGMTTVMIQEAEGAPAITGEETGHTVESPSHDQGVRVLADGGNEKNGPTGFAEAAEQDDTAAAKANLPSDHRSSEAPEPFLISIPNLDAYRPLSERAQDPQIAEAQRREFFNQLHRWLRQGFGVHVFCNNEGERERFAEIWQEYGLADSSKSSLLLQENQDSEFKGGLTPKHETSSAALPSPLKGERARVRGGTDQAPTPRHFGAPVLPEPTSPQPSPPVRRAERENRHAHAEEGRLGSLFSTHLGTLARGFLSHEAKIAVVTDAEIFGRYKVQRPRRLKSRHAVAARSALDIDFTDLAEGDYVVHLQYGIGRYVGLKLLPLGEGRKAGSQTQISPSRSGANEGGQECLVIEYAADSDQPAPKLYVPVTEAHLVSKYVGAGKARPALNTLGGARWAKTKAQAEQAVRDLAGGLLAIQAARESQPGHAFPLDAPWQREFESAFIYEETPDQLRAIVQTKSDMEAAKPMDRLICGDVGYGKTEVAIRAAFKAVMGGRQVALLVPTTVLAQQHFNTFRERMADYPIRIEQLSRFRSRAEQRKTLHQLSDGSIDIIIGTHRLIQEDVAFKDLGLVVIDEEQRFGVLHKEKFKMLRQLVDVLTLSATPIPRTLYLALTGARDMSTIETPPQDRLPVETIVAQYDERLIRDAIQREINREGQVYFLHNRVLDIDQVALRIKALVPQARVLVGHGQMDSDELEEIMTRFVSGEADVLVSTTIIESGIDIPNANTIIIDRADRFGLSDLYQLRGRVGRYKHQAYAYLLLPRHAALLSDVRKRISAIKQYSSLGSGFKIAMRDLEIRGAGNLLGPQQSGHITAVGFELYCQLLKQSVSALKGEKVKPRVEVQVRLDFLAMSPGEETIEESSKFKVQSSKTADGGSSRFKAQSSKSDDLQLNVPRETATYRGDVSSPGADSALRTPHAGLARVAAYIPLKYIAEAQQRIEVYRKLAQVTDKPSLERLREELRDRFGKLPPAGEILLQVSELKFIASERGITAVETKEDKLMLTRNNDFIMVAGKFPRLVKKEAKARLGEIKKLLLAL